MQEEQEMCDFLFVSAAVYGVSPYSIYIDHVFNSI
jgi:hypothetical protein